MSEGDSSKRPPSVDELVFRKILLLCIGFLPSVAGIASFHFKDPPPGLLVALLIVDIICSIAAGVGLVRGMKNEGLQFLLGVLLIPSFFVLNVFIVLYVGCSGAGGRIAP